MPRRLDDGELTPKEGLAEFAATGMRLLPNGMFGVKLDNSHDVLALTWGKMRENRTPALADSRVNVDMTPNDLTKGLIKFLFK